MGCVVIVVVLAVGKGQLDIVEKCTYCGALAGQSVGVVAGVLDFIC